MNTNIVWPTTIFELKPRLERNIRSIRKHLWIVFDEAASQLRPEHQVSGAALCRVVELAAPTLVGKPLLLLKLWRFVLGWATTTFGTSDWASFYTKMTSMGYADLDFIQYAELTIPAYEEIERSGGSVDTTVGGCTWYLHVKLTPDELFYGMRWA